MTTVLSSKTARSLTAVVVCLCVALSACGGSDDGDARGGTSTSGTAATGPPPTEREAGAADAARERADSLPGPPPEREPVEVPATGDRSLQTFGEPAPEGDYLAIGRTVRAYYLAMADRDVPALCGLLADGARKGFKLLAERLRKVPDDVDCVTVLRGVAPTLPARFARAYRRVRVTDARTDGVKGFAFIEIPRRGRSAISLYRDANQWRIATMGAIPLD